MHRIPTRRGGVLTLPQDGAYNLQYPEGINDLIQLAAAGKILVSCSDCIGITQIAQETSPNGYILVPSDAFLNHTIWIDLMKLTRQLNSGVRFTLLALNQCPTADHCGIKPDFNQELFLYSDPSPLH